MSARTASKKTQDVRVVHGSVASVWLWAVLLAAVAGSAASGLYVSHLCRGQYRLAQALETDVWDMQVEYGRMLLEQSALAPPAKVETVAVERLGMRKPGLFNTRLVRP